MNFILSLIISFSYAIEAPKGWFPLNAKRNPICAADAPCALGKDIADSKFHIVSEFVVQDGKLKIEKVMVKNSKNKIVSEFTDFDGFQLLFPSEKLDIFGADINDDGHLDFALFSSLSLQEGDTFFYYLYNPKTKKFVLSGKSLEVLRPSGKKIAGAATGTQYQVTKDYKIIRL